MKNALKLGAPFGIGLYVHWSFALLIGYLLSIGAGIPGVLMVLSLFGCVTLHEYGHALAARHYGIPTRSVTLYPIGGIARLARMPRDPKQELLIAIAGPAVNVLIAVVLAPLALISGGLDPLVADGFLTQLVFANIFLVIFNLIPAFPMDGGRVLRALLAFVTGHARATQIAARTGQVFAVLFGLAGVLKSLPMFVIIGVFIFFAAEAERRASLMAAPGPPPRPRPGSTRPPPIPPSSGNTIYGDWEILPPEPGNQPPPPTPRFRKADRP